MNLGPTEHTIIISYLVYIPLECSIHALLYDKFC